MPNLKCKEIRWDKDRERLWNYNDVSITLSNGVCILWNGQAIRHFTSVTNVGEDNVTFGAFFAPKEKIVKNPEDFSQGNEFDLRNQYKDSGDEGKGEDLEEEEDSSSEGDSYFTFRW